MSTSSKLFFTNIDSLSGLTESNGGTGWCDGGECFADVTDGGGGGVYFGGVCVGGAYCGGMHNGGVHFTPTSCIDSMICFPLCLHGWGESFGVFEG